MFKKPQPEPPSKPSPPPVKPGPAAPPRRTTAMIGPSIVIKGDLTGEEDLLIEGRIEGEIRLQNQNVTVGRNGRVQADVHGKSIQVEGEVIGNLWGEDEVVIRQTGKVEGNVTAPRVTLEDGSSFRGAIDMQSAQKRGAAAPQAASPRAAAASRQAAKAD